MQEEPVREVNTAASRRDPFSILNGNSSEGTNGVRPQQNGHHTFKNGDKRVPGSPVNGSPARSTESTSTSSHAESLEMFAFPSFISKYDHYDPMDPINFRHAYPLQLVKGKRRIWRGIKNPAAYVQRPIASIRRPLSTTMTASTTPNQVAPGVSTSSNYPNYTVSSRKTAPQLASLNVQQVSAPVSNHPTTTAPSIASLEKTTVVPAPTTTVNPSPVAETSTAANTDQNIYQFIVTSAPMQPSASQSPTTSSTSTVTDKGVYQEQSSQTATPPERLPETPAKRIPIREWLNKWKLNDPEVCCICYLEVADDNNPFVYCDGPDCDVIVHQACYGIEKCPSENDIWLCDRCKNLQNTATRPLMCALCPNIRGAFRKLAQPFLGMEWVHVSCAQWIPRVQIWDKKNMKDISLEKVPAEALYQKCIVCEGEPYAEYGACLQCPCDGCNNWFHVSCGFKYGLIRKQVTLHTDVIRCFIHDRRKSMRAASRAVRLNEWDRWVNKRDEFLTYITRYNENEKRLQGWQYELIRTGEVAESVTTINDVIRIFRLRLDNYLYGSRHITQGDMAEPRSPVLVDDEGDSQSNVQSRNIPEDDYHSESILVLDDSIEQSNENSEKPAEPMAIDGHEATTSQTAESAVAEVRKSPVTETVEQPMIHSAAESAQDADLKTADTEDGNDSASEYADALDTVSQTFADKDNQGESGAISENDLTLNSEKHEMEETSNGDNKEQPPPPSAAESLEETTNNREVEKQLGDLLGIDEEVEEPALAPYVPKYILKKRILEKQMERKQAAQEPTCAREKPSKSTAKAPKAEKSKAFKKAKKRVAVEQKEQQREKPVAEPPRKRAKVVKDFANAVCAECKQNVMPQEAIDKLELGEEYMASLETTKHLRPDNYTGKANYWDPRVFIECSDCKRDFHCGCCDPPIKDYPKAHVSFRCLECDLKHDELFEVRLPAGKDKTERLRSRKVVNYKV